MHQPGVKPGSHRWQRCILPLDHCFSGRALDLIHIGSRSPCTPFSSSLHDTTFPRQSTPHFLALFQPPVRNPQETPWKPKETLTVAAEPPPSKCLHTPFAPLQGFHPASRVSFLGADASHSIGRRQHTTLEHTFRARQLDPCAEDVMPPGTQDPLAWHQPSPLLTSRHLWDSNPRGETHRLSRPTRVFCKICKSAAFQSRQSCDCQSLLLVPPSPRHLTRA